MSEPQYIIDLKKHGEGDPTSGDLGALEIELYDGPDRAAAVVMASLVDRSIARLLENRGHAKAAKGTFSVKIQSAFDLGLVGPDTQHDLTLVRHLRNQFAHSRLPIEFTTPVVERVCEELRIPDWPAVFINFRMLNAVSPERLEQASDIQHPRTRFFTSCNEIAQRIFFLRGGGDANDPLNTLR